MLQDYQRIGQDTIRSRSPAGRTHGSALIAASPGGMIGCKSAVAGYEGVCDLSGNALEREDACQVVALATDEPERVLAQYGLQPRSAVCLTKRAAGATVNMFT